MRDDMLETFSIDELPAMKDIDEKYWLKTPMAVWPVSRPISPITALP